MSVQDAVTTGPPEAETQPPNKRRRIALACSSCRARKSRCDGARPICSLCSELGFHCVYTVAASSSNVIIGKEYISDLESRLTQVEGALGTANSKITNLERIVSQPVQYRASRHASLENDELRQMDDAANESHSLDGMGAVTFEAEAESAYFGPSSNIAFLRHISRAMARMTRASQARNTPSDSSVTLVDIGYVSISRPASPVGRSSTHHGHSKSLSNLYDLPPHEEIMSCIDRYFSDTGVLFPYIHAESFVHTYKQMESQNTEKVRRTWLGLLNMILAMATNAIVDPTVKAVERISRSDVFYQRAQGLCQKQIMRGASLEIVQLLLLMSQYLQGTQKPMETWLVHGMAVKAALALGLHCGDAAPRFSPLEREVRNRTWYGCVVFDRTLSMTFGRPCSIPDSYIKLPLPSPYPPSSSLGDSDDMPTESLVVSFYTATITLYNVMANVIESLYANNLTSQRDGNINDVLSQLFRLEQELSRWESSLPPELTLLTAEEVSPIDLTGVEIAGLNEISRQRFRNILTLRYLNLRLLLHRPILTKLVESSVDRHSATKEGFLLQQMRQSSLQVCVNSADLIILIVYVSLQTESRPRWNLIGAWWFSLYYTFNAALVIAASLLANGSEVDEVSIAGRPSADSAFESMQRAQAALKALDNRNSMVDRCCHYLEQLTQMLKKIVPGNFELQFNSDDANDTSQQFPKDPQQYASLYSSDTSHMPFDLDLGQFVLDSDFDLLNHHLDTSLRMPEM